MCVCVYVLTHLFPNFNYFHFQPVYPSIFNIYMEALYDLDSYENNNIRVYDANS